MATRRRENVCRRLPAARRRQKYEPGITARVWQPLVDIVTINAHLSQVHRSIISHGFLGNNYPCFRVEWSDLTYELSLLIVVNMYLRCLP